MADFDLLVVGAGVIGLAAARAAAKTGARVLITERAARFGSETSARNSEVVHAGIYYTPGSLKARLCIEGRRQLYAYAEERAIATCRTGKLIVAASDAQIAALRTIVANAEANGVDDLSLLDRSELAALEPELSAAWGLLSPSTGIIDSHALMLALLGEAENYGAQLVTRAEIVRLGRTRGGWQAWIADEAHPILTARAVLNAAGLWAPQLTERIDGFPRHLRVTPRYAKGNYFSYGAPPPFRHLIYPLPEIGGLGIHLTLDLAGRARFGPDVEWSDMIDYSVNTARKEVFLAAIRSYWPGVDGDCLEPDFVGVRPKLAGPEADHQDFVVQGPSIHGLPGLVNLYGIESPGLTSSLPLGELAARIAMR